MICPIGMMTTYGEIISSRIKVELGWLVVEMVDGGRLVTW